MRITSTVTLLSLAISLGSPALATGQKAKDRKAREESRDHFKKWLNEDVKYIITPDEKAVFEKLMTPDEKQQFVEQFWYRRDPDLRTSINEYKEEHYRRIAYANDRFQSGIPGWKTDRGRIYIIHGPPTEVISYPSGGRYLRKPSEGGGSTSTFPFETWRYRHIDGVGDNIELEFVDPTWAGEFHLATNPDEKDALLRVPNAGLTLAEKLGRARKMDRPFFQPGMRERYPLLHSFQNELVDNPFARFERFAKVQRPQPIKYKDLQDIIKINVTYNNLLFNIQEDYFNLNDQQDLVPLTLEVRNKDLKFKEENGVYTTRLAIYGAITTITNRLIGEFEDDVVVSYKSDKFQEGLSQRSAYQKIIVLDKNMRYKLDLVVKDMNSEDVGVIRKGIAPPAYDDQKLQSSSLILSNLIVPLRDPPSEIGMFVLGDIKVRPSVRNVFSTKNLLGLYMQLYNLGIDQTSRLPSVETRYKISRDGQTVLELTGATDQGLRLYAERRAALVKALPVENLAPGSYQLDVQIIDRIRGDSIHVSQAFKLIS